MPKGSPELTKDREEEIINACAKLYKTMSFKDISIKEIAGELSFSRASIYNYYQTKEEIFLDLLKREYESWCRALKKIVDSNESMSKDELAEKLASSIDGRENMLKLLSMNLNEMEANSRIENLVYFKKPYGETMKLVRATLDKFCPDMKNEEKQAFIYSFFPFLYGIYPYTVVSDNQREAMKIAGIDYKYMSIYDITLMAIKKML